MANYLKLDMGEGLELYVKELDSAAPGGKVNATGQRLSEADGRKLLEETLPAVSGFAKAVAEKLRDSSPDELELSFSVGFKSGLSVILASTDMNGSIGVKVKWKKKD